MAIATIERRDPVVRLEVRPPEFAASEAERIEILVALPAELHAESHSHFEEDEPTWEDAEWQ